MAELRSIPLSSPSHWGARCWEQPRALRAPQGKAGPSASGSGHCASVRAPGPPSLEAECKAAARNAEGAACAQDTCLSRAQSTKRRGPQLPQTSSGGGREDRKGEVTRGPGAPGRPEPLWRQGGPEGGGWNPPLGNCSLGGKERPDWSPGTHQGCRDPPSCTCRPAPPRQGAPGTPGWDGGAFLPPPRARREGRTPRARGGRTNFGATTFSGRRAGGLRLHAHAAPGESASPEPRGNPSGWGGRQETRGGRGERGCLGPGRGLRENFRRGGR